MEDSQRCYRDICYISRLIFQNLNENFEENKNLKYRSAIDASAYASIMSYYIDIIRVCDKPMCDDPMPKYPHIKVKDYINELHDRIIDLEPEITKKIISIMQHDFV